MQPELRGLFGPDSGSYKRMKMIYNQRNHSGFHETDINRITEVCMYKVVIADDEVKLCQLIENIIDWKSLDATIVGTANDGISALDLVRDRQPDVLITDIRMPGYDGLELIAKAKEADSRLQIIVISGYRQFEYARTAMQYGVENYLLKPINEEELYEILRGIFLKKQKEQADQSRTESLEKIVETDGKVMRERFMEYVCHPSEGNPLLTDADEVNRIYHCHFKHGLFQGWLLKPDIPIKNMTMEEYGILLRRSEEQVRKEAENYPEMVVLTLISMEGVYILINHGETAETDMHRIFNRLQSMIGSWRDLFWDISVTVGMGENVSTVEEIPVTMKQAKRAVFSRVFSGNGQIIPARNVRVSGHRAEELLTSARRTQMEERVKMLDINGVISLIEEISAGYLAMNDTDGLFLYETVQELMNVFFFAMRHLDPDFKEKQAMDRFYEYFCMCTKPEEIFQFLRKIILQYLAAADEQRSRAEAKPVRDAKKYIIENFDKPLKLDEISSMLGFNSAYFSSLFKKETGENLSEFLMKVRIEKAKELLVSTDASLVDIAEQVGYTDLKYFSKLFKKEIEISPSDYRKLYHQLH